MLVHRFLSYRVQMPLVHFKISKLEVSFSETLRVYLLQNGLVRLFQRELENSFAVRDF